MSHLSTVDFLGLRFVSRAMVLVFSLQSFRQTRFQINGDRGHLSCLADMKSRKRKNWPSSLYGKDWSPRLSSLDPAWQWMNNYCLADRGLMAPALREYLPVTQSVSLQAHIIGLAVSILDEPTERETNIHYGIWSDGCRCGNVTIGYRLPRREIIINLLNQQLRGFISVTSVGGIRGTRPIFQRQRRHKLDWAPTWEDKCNLTEITLKDEIKAISANFDVSHSFYPDMWSHYRTRPTWIT